MSIGEAPERGVIVARVVEEQPCAVPELPGEVLRRLDVSPLPARTSPHDADAAQVVAVQVEPVMHFRWALLSLLVVVRRGRPDGRAGVNSDGELPRNAEIEFPSMGVRGRRQPSFGVAVRSWKTPAWRFSRRR